MIIHRGGINDDVFIVVAHKKKKKKKRKKESCSPVPRDHARDHEIRTASFSISPADIGLRRPRARVFASAYPMDSHMHLVFIADPSYVI